MNIDWSSSLAGLAHRFGPQVAVSDRRGQALSFDQLHRRAHALATHLKGLGMPAGTPVASLLPNGLEAVWVAYGLRLSGVAETPLGWALTDEELRHCAMLAGFRQVVTLPERMPDVVRLGLEAQPVLPGGYDDQGQMPAVLPAVAADIAGRILFTSGTTGRPKGVVYTHGARHIGEQMQTAAWPFLPKPGERLLLMTPFIHGASLLAFGWLAQGGEVVLHPGVDLPAIHAELSANRLTAVFAPPTVLAKLTTAFASETFQGIRCIFTGTQPLPPALYARACRLFGPVVRITYGKSECINPITVLSPEQTQALFQETDRPAGACVGWPAPGVEIRIEPADDGDGEIWLRAPQMSQGMLVEGRGFMPHGPDGWHGTGDLGFIDAQGRLVLTGRVADVIKTGGYRVNPDEIESRLADLKDAAAVCVTAIASDYWGEIIVAVAEGARQGWQQSAQARLEGLSRHKQPRMWVALKTLPRNAQGKLSRREVARALLAEYTLQDGPYPSLRPNRP